MPERGRRIKSYTRKGAPCVFRPLWFCVVGTAAAGVGKARGESEGERVFRHGLWWLGWWLGMEGHGQRNPNHMHKPRPPHDPTVEFDGTQAPACAASPPPVCAQATQVSGQVHGLGHGSFWPWPHAWQRRRVVAPRLWCSREGRERRAKWALRASFVGVVLPARRHASFPWTQHGQQTRRWIPPTCIWQEQQGDSREKRDPSAKTQRSVLSRSEAFGKTVRCKPKHTRAKYSSVLARSSGTLRVAVLLASWSSDRSIRGRVGWGWLALSAWVCGCNNVLVPVEHREARGIILAPPSLFATKQG